MRWIDRYSALVFISALVLSCFLPAGQALAEQVRLPLVSEQTRSSVQMPERGASKKEVLERFGDPVRRVAEIGQPPISEWIYPRFKVYFEADRVLHSVVPPERSPSAE